MNNNDIKRTNIISDINCKLGEIITTIISIKMMSVMLIITILMMKII